MSGCVCVWSVALLTQLLIPPHTNIHHSIPLEQAADHRVLIFSQFKIMLDVLEDYLQSRGFSFGRVDGSVTGDKRQVG